VEQDRVAFLFNQLGTPTNSAIHRYVNQRRIPHLFLATGADKWANPREYPWTMGWQPSYRIEAQIYAKHLLEQRPYARVALLYQNDDFGKDYVAGVRDVLGRASTPRSGRCRTRRQTRRSTRRSSAWRRPAPTR
jgi:branched-chain amino acid transport system substrate-binding protein